MQATPTRMSTSARDNTDSQSESGDVLKQIQVTVTLIIPKKDKNGKGKKPDIVQKQFQMDVLGSEQRIEPSIFWKTTLEALGPSYSTTYIPGNGSGQWPVFKWRKEGTAYVPFHVYQAKLSPHL